METTTVTAAIRINARGREVAHAVTCNHKGDAARTETRELHTVLFAPAAEVADCLAATAWATFNQSPDADVLLAAKVHAGLA